MFVNFRSDLNHGFSSQMRNSYLLCQCMEKEVPYWLVSSNYLGTFMFNYDCKFLSAKGFKVSPLKTVLSHVPANFT